MHKATCEASREAGSRVTTVEEFLGLTDEKAPIVALRVALGRRVRELREVSHLTQQQLAARIESSQSRVAKIEAADPGVSLDLMFRGSSRPGAGSPTWPRRPAVAGPARLDRRPAPGRGRSPGPGPGPFADPIGPTGLREVKLDG